MSRRLLATAAAMALGVCGCGALGGGDPAARAADTADSASLRFHATGGITVDPLPGGLFAGGRSLAVVADGEQEARGRIALRMTAPPVLTGRAAVAEYDGVTYVAPDGTHWQRGPALAGLALDLTIRPTDVADLLRRASLTDTGATTRDGESVRHLHGSLDRSLLDRGSDLVGAAGAGGVLPAIVTEAGGLSGGTVDAWLRTSDGSLEAMTVTATHSVDLSALSAIPGGERLPSGTVSLHQSLSVRLFDYGAHITVARPQVDPTAPTFGVQP